MKTFACLPQALTAYQAGILLVECFPYIPDLIMLMRELAISQSAPSSHELLTKGAMRYAEKQGAADIKVSAQFARELVSSGQSPATVSNIPTAVSCNT